MLNHGHQSSRVYREAQEGLPMQVDALSLQNSMFRTWDYAGCWMCISQQANAVLHSQDIVHPYVQDNDAL